MEIDPNRLIARVRRGLAVDAPNLRREAVAALRPELPADVQAAAQDATRDLGRYILVGALGRGGAAEVWSAWDRDLSRRVAVKLLLTEAGGLQAARRFQREAAVAGQIRHPNIVAVHDAGEWKERLYLVMDLIEGGDLSKWISGRDVEPARIAELVEKVARAIHEAHQRGIIHRDLKPSNVLMDERGEPLVSDFGLAVWELHPERITAPGGLVGTPPYMAPEQFHGQPDVRTDVYAIGVMLYETLAGVLPYRSTAIGRLIQLIEAGDAPPPSTLKPLVPPDLDAICMRAMARDPADRYASAFALAEDLRRFRAGEPIEAKTASRVTLLVRWTRRRRSTLAVVVAVLLGVVATVTLSTRSSARASASREVQRAAVAYREGRLDEALAAAQRAVQHDRDLAEGHFWIGRVHLRRYLGHWQLPTPWRLFVGLEFGEPPQESAEAREYRLAAERAFAAIQQHSSEGWEGPCAEGMLQLLKGGYAEAERRLASARSHPGMSPDREVDALYGLSLYYQKRFASSLEVLVAIPPPLDPLTSVALARALHGVALECEHRGDSPLDTYERAIATNAASACAARTSRAMYLDRRGALDAGAEIDAVIAELDRRRDDRIAMALACLLGSKIAWHATKFERRRELLDRALAELAAVRAEGAIAAWVEAAVRVNRLDLDRDFDAAGRAVDRAARLLGPVPDVVILQAQMIAARKPDAAGAREAYDHLVLTGASPELHAQRGHLALMWLLRAEDENRDDLDAEAAARSCYGECLRRDPAHIGALSGLGNVLLSLGRRQAERRIDPATMEGLEAVVKRLEDAMPGGHSAKHLQASLASIRGYWLEQTGGDPLAAYGDAVLRNSEMLTEGGCDPGALALAMVDGLSREHTWRSAAGMAIDATRLKAARDVLARVDGDVRVKLASALLDMLGTGMGSNDAAARYRAVLDAIDPVVAGWPRQVGYLAIRAQVELNLAIVHELSGADGAAMCERAVRDASKVLDAKPGMVSMLVVRMKARVALTERSLLRGALDGQALQATLDDMREVLPSVPEPWRVRCVRARLLIEAAALSRRDRVACRGYLAGIVEDLEGAIASIPLRPLALGIRARARLLGALIDRDGPRDAVRAAAEASLQDLSTLGEADAWVLAVRGHARLLRAWAGDGARAEYEAAYDDVKRAIAAGMKREGMVEEAAAELERLLH